MTPARRRPQQGRWSSTADRSRTCDQCQTALLGTGLTADHGGMTKHISVGYDGTKSAAEAVLWASDEAAARAATLRILCCYDVPIASDGMVGFGFAEAMAVLDSTAQTSAREMAAIVAARHPELHIIPSVSPGPAAPLLTEGLEQL